MQTAKIDPREVLDRSLYVVAPDGTIASVTAHRIADERGAGETVIFRGPEGAGHAIWNGAGERNAEERIRAHWDGFASRWPVARFADAERAAKR